MSWPLVCSVLGVITTAVAVIALIVHQFAFTWRPAIVLAAFARYPMIGALLGAVLFAVAARWWAVLVAIVVCALAVASQAPLYVGQTAPSNGTKLVVLQANLRIGSADPARLAATVVEQHVEVLMTEELTVPERDRLVAAGLSATLPYRFDAASPGGGGLAIWSRYPLSDETNYPGYRLGVLRARVTLPSGQTPTVYAVHLLPPYPYASRTWVTEIGRLRTLLAGEAAKQVVVAGDFNATPDVAQFRRLSSHGYADAADQSGAGYLASYPTDRALVPPLIAIDHVLTRGGVATKASTVALPGSDHRGLLVHLSLS